MSSDHYLSKYFSLIEKSYSERLEKSDLSEEVREGIKIRQEVTSQIKANIEWLMMSPIDRHAARIEWIASLKKRNVDVTSKLQCIAVYDKIQETLPYIKVLNLNGNLDEFTALCISIIEKIDFQGRLFGNIEVNAEVINKAFNDTEKIIGGSIHSESEKKLIELREVLLVFLLK